MSRPPRSISVAGVAVLLAAALGAPVAAQAGRNFDTQLAPTPRDARDPRGFIPSPSDFNADGYDDLAIGAPFDDVNGVRRAGTVNVIYGSSTGLSPTAGPGDQLWSQDSPQVGNRAESGDQFGWTVATGNFDGDSFGDLAIGAIGEDLERPSGTVADVGLVHILYGSPNGLTGVGSKVFNAAQATGGQFDDPSTDSGFALVALDNSRTDNAVGRDGHSELAVGVPGYAGDDGAVIVLSGGYVDRTQVLSFALFFYGDAGSGSRFGSALAAGRFDATEPDDLAIGAPLAEGPETRGGLLRAGAVRLVRNEFYESTHHAPGIGDDQAAEAGDNFGHSLAAGDLDENGYDDLAVGSPLEDMGSVVDAGFVQLFFSQPASGPAFTTGFGVDIGTDRPGVPQPGDLFGSSLAIGELGDARPPTARGDSAWYPDLIVGVPRRDIRGLVNAGAVVIFYRSDGNWNEINNPMVNQDFGSDLAEEDDRYGTSIAVGSFGNGLLEDLVIGAPLEDIGARADAGLVHVIYGGRAGPGSRGERLFTQDSPGIEDTAQPGDKFGRGLP